MKLFFCKISNFSSTMLGTTSDDVEWGMKGGLQCIDKKSKR